MLQNLSPVNHCDCAAPIRSPRSWANGFFKNRGSSCKRSLSLLPQISRGQFAENRFEALLSNWKSARVIPLFKQGEQNDLNNYRPISVISVVFWRIVYDQLYTYLAKNDFIYISIGFSHNLFDCHCVLYLRLRILGSITLTQEKSSFDTVDHEILLSKLSNYGKCDNAHSWLVILGQPHA